MFGRRGSPPQYPLHVKPKDLDAIIITHAHLDHSGNVPSLFVSGNTDVYATPPTFDLSKLLINDKSIKLLVSSTVSSSITTGFL